MTGLIVYKNEDEISVYKYEDIGGRKSKMLSVSFNKNGELIKNKNYGEREKDFYKENKEEIVKRKEQIIIMWHNIYDN